MFEVFEVPQKLLLSTRFAGTSKGQDRCINNKSPAKLLIKHLGFSCQMRILFPSEQDELLAATITHGGICKYCSQTRCRVKIFYSGRVACDGEVSVVSEVGAISSTCNIGNIRKILPPCPLYSVFTVIISASPAPLRPEHRQM